MRNEGNQSNANRQKPVSGTVVDDIWSTFPNVHLRVLAAEKGSVEIQICDCGMSGHCRPQGWARIEKHNRQRLANAISGPATPSTEAQKCVLCRHNNVGEDGQCNEPLPHEDRDGHYTCLCRCVFSAGAEEYADGPSGLEQGKSVDEVMANFAEYDLPETTDEEPTGCLDDNDALSREIVENWRRANDWPGLVWSAQNLSDEPRWLAAWTSLEQRIAAGLRTRPVEPRCSPKVIALKLFDCCGSYARRTILTRSKGSKIHGRN